MGIGRLVVSGLLAVGLAAPAAAGTVYSWITEDGTYAFTDDAKRIPAKHKNDARRRNVGRLDRYERYTPVSEKERQSYADRVVARRDELRQARAVAPEGALVGAAGATTGLTLPVASGGSGARSNPSLWIPMEGANASMDRARNADQPLVFESKRMDDPGRLTTRHWTFVTRGDEVVTVIKGEHRQRGLTERVREDDFRYWDPEEDR